MAIKKLYSNDAKSVVATCFASFALAAVATTVATTTATPAPVVVAPVVVAPAVVVEALGKAVVAFEALHCKIRCRHSINFKGFG